MSAWIQGLLALITELVLAWLALTVAPERLRPALLIAILLLGVVVAALILTQRKRGASSRVPRLSTEDRAALQYRLLLGETARRGKPLRRRAAKRFLNRRFREIERQWAVVDVEVAECKPAFYGDAVWTPDVSKVETGVMLSLYCSNMGLLTNIACRVDDQQGMKHQSPRTGPLAWLEVRFKYPVDFEGADPLPHFGEWHEAAWFQPNDDPEIGAIDPGLGKEIVTCRFRVIQSNPAISSSVQT